MLKDITLGQYFPGNTPAHHLDPRTKILLVLFYIVALFCAGSFVAYGLLAVVLAVCVRVSRVGFKALVKGLKPVLFIIVFTGILNLFFTPGDNYLFAWGPFHISDTGLRNAAFMVLRIMLLIMGTFLMTYTTSPISLTDGLERLLSGLKRFHMPVHELTMIMSIALRFIPTLIEETDKIMSAQKARGADFESGNLFQKAKAMVPIPAGRRTGNRNGMPLLPWRRGPDKAPHPALRTAGLHSPDLRRGDSCDGDFPAVLWTVSRLEDLFACETFQWRFWKNRTAARFTTLCPTMCRKYKPAAWNCLSR